MTDGRRTRVVNLRKDRYDVYIGRAGRGQDGYFGNPFPLGEQPRGATIERYRGYFLNRLRTDEQFARRIRELKGKTLGCFCKPHPCHGDVIAEYLDTPVRLAVVGSRTFGDYALMCEVLGRFEITEIISGGARGADALALDSAGAALRHGSQSDPRASLGPPCQGLAERYAHERGLPIKVFPADWGTHGRSAGFLRNRKIVAEADEVVAFWYGRCRGTQHTIGLARTSGKVVYIHGPTP